MVPQWLKEFSLGRVILYILLIAALAAPAASEWRTVPCSSDFGDEATCCEWCFLLGCNRCEFTVEPPAGVVGGIDETP